MRQEDKTFMLKDQEVEHQWIILDAAGKTLGRFAAEAAKILRGKHKIDFTPFADGGDGVIVLNANKIIVTGRKEASKVYRHYTGHIGGLREIPYRTMMEKHPERIIERAVAGMMPKTKLGNRQLKRLRIFVGTEHNMDAQKPIAVSA